MEPISKRQAKLQKIQKKRTSSKPQVSQVYDKEPNDNIITEKDSNIQIQYIDPVNQLKKAKQWWKSIDITYFKPVKLKNILLTRNSTSGDKLKDFYESQGQLRGSYQNEEIFSHYPNLSQNTLINVLFKTQISPVKNLVSFSFVNYVQNFNKRATKNLKEQEVQIDIYSEFKIYPFNKKPQTLSVERQYIQQQDQEILKCSNLQLESFLTDNEILNKIQRVQNIRQKMKDDKDINQQIEMWKEQQQVLNTSNKNLWDNMISNHQQIIQLEQKNLESEISTIKQSLMHYTILRYMEHGTRDKTQEMLKQLLDNLKLIKPAKTREQTNKKFFQTDCKICFCSFNYDSNQVLYCDMCNTSYHLACYGLQQIPQQKEYFCDRCVALKKQQKINNNLKKLTCQICCKPNFPIKNIDGHFYHMTCLILFNFITIKDQKIQLRQGINHLSIIKKVIESELQCGPCIFCLGSSGAEMGMQIKCSVEGCGSSMHPICAYINGCEFFVKKSMGQKKLQVKILCNKHDIKRDYIQQTYLRRYMCNFKNTSQKSLQSFSAEYQAETLSRKPKNNDNKQKIPSIIVDTKIIRRYLSQKQQKKTQKNQDIVSTQTRKIFEKLLKNN